jgi:hypothetical protein
MAKAMITDKLQMLLKTFVSEFPGPYQVRRSQPASQNKVPLQHDLHVTYYQKPGKELPIGPFLSS